MHLLYPLNFFVLFKLLLFAFNPFHPTEIALEKEIKDFIIRGSLFHSVIILSTSAGEFVPLDQVCLLENSLFPLSPILFSPDSLHKSLVFISHSFPPLFL